MTTYKNSLIFAYLQGFYEMWTRQFGRTHETIGEWNESYDLGGNAAERICLLLGREVGQ